MNFSPSRLSDHATCLCTWAASHIVATPHVLAMQAVSCVWIVLHVVLWVVLTDHFQQARLMEPSEWCNARIMLQQCSLLMARLCPSHGSVFHGWSTVFSVSGPLSHYRWSSLTTFENLCRWGHLSAPSWTTSYIDKCWLLLIAVGQYCLLRSTSGHVLAHGSWSPCISCSSQRASSELCEPHLMC